MQPSQGPVACCQLFQAEHGSFLLPLDEQLLRQVALPAAGAIERRDEAGAVELAELRNVAGPGAHRKDAIDPALVVSGTKVQPSIYAAAIQDQYPGIDVDSRYWFASTKGEFKFVDVTVKPVGAQQG